MFICWTCFLGFSSFFPATCLSNRTSSTLALDDIYRALMDKYAPATSKKPGAFSKGFISLKCPVVAHQSYSPVPRARPADQLVLLVPSLVAAPCPPRQWFNMHLLPIQPGKSGAPQGDLKQLQVHLFEFRVWSLKTSSDTRRTQVGEDGTSVTSWAFTWTTDLESVNRCPRI